MEEDTRHQLEMFDFFGIPKTFTYHESVNEVIRLYSELLREKIERDKHEFRVNLFNIQKILN